MAPTVMTAERPTEEHIVAAKLWADDFFDRGYKCYLFSRSLDSKRLAPGMFCAFIVSPDGAQFSVEGKADNVQSVTITGGRSFLVTLKAGDVVIVKYKLPPRKWAVIYVVTFKLWEQSRSGLTTIKERIILRPERAVVFLATPNRKIDLALLPEVLHAKEDDNVATDLVKYTKYDDLETSYQRTVLCMPLRSKVSITAKPGLDSTRSDKDAVIEEQVDGMPWIRFKVLKENNGEQNNVMKNNVRMEPDKQLVAEEQELFEEMEVCDG